MICASGMLCFTSLGVSDLSMYWCYWLNFSIFIAGRAVSFFRRVLLVDRVGYAGVLLIYGVVMPLHPGWLGGSLGRGVVFS